MIKELKAEASFGVIKDTFEWKKIPNFAVITGENGSGKTQLLRQIAGLEREKIFPKIDRNKVRYWHGKDFGVKEVIYNDNESVQEFLDFVQKIQKPEEYIHRHIKTFLENDSNKENPPYDIRGIFEKYGGWLKRNELELRDLFYDDYNDLREKITKNFDKNFTSQLSLFDPQLFMNVVGQYHLRFEELERKIKNDPKKSKTYTHEQTKHEIEKEIGENPVEKINNILKNKDGKFGKFDGYGKVTIDTKRTDNGVVPFCRDQEGNEIPFEQLSTGEQIIIALVIWQYDKTAVQPTTILLDEPDAFLNPKMLKMLISILRETVVKRFKCQVIVTTHSMVTVVQCEDKNLFYMENGEIYKTSRNESLNRLSQGFIAQEMFDFVGRLMKCSYFLCVEGASDKIHLEKYPKYKEILVGNNGVLEIVDCGGADSMEYYANFFKNFKNGLTRKALFIFDYDSKGIEAKNKVENVLSQDNAFSQYNTMFVSEGQVLVGNPTFTIENCYGDDQQVMRSTGKSTPPCKWSSKEKMRFANRRSTEEVKKSGLSILIQEIKKRLNGLEQQMVATK